MTKLYAFDTINNTVGSLFDVILFVEEFGCIPRKVEFSDIYSVRVKDDLSRAHELHDALKANNRVAFKDLSNLRDTKPELLQFQSNPLKHSLIDLNEDYCDGKKRSALFRKVGIKMFQDVLKMMGIDSHSGFDVVSKFKKVLVLCQHEKLLRDELLFQLIKQTTNNPNSVWNARGWTLLYLATKYLIPRSDTAKVLRCHAAAVADPTYSDQCHGANSIKQYAHRIFVISTERIWQIQHEKVRALPKPKKSELHRVLNPNPTVIRVRISKFLQRKDSMITVNCGGGRDGGNPLDLQGVCAAVLKSLGIKGDPQMLGVTVDVHVRGTEEVQRQSMWYFGDGSDRHIFCVLISSEDIGGGAVFGSNFDAAFDGVERVSIDIVVVLLFPKSVCRHLLFSQI